MHSHWKAAILVLGLSLVAAASVPGQVVNSVEGLHPVPDANRGDEAQSPPTGSQSVPTITKSLDHEKARRNERQGPALAAAGKAEDSAGQLSALGGSTQAWSRWSFNLSERTVIAIVAAIGGVASVVAGAYTWRVRTSADYAAPVLLNVAHAESPNARREEIDEQQLPQKRRAA